MFDQSQGLNERYPKPVIERETVRSQKNAILRSGQIYRSVPLENDGSGFCPNPTFEDDEFKEDNKALNDQGEGERELMFFLSSLKSLSSTSSGVVLTFSTSQALDLST